MLRKVLNNLTTKNVFNFSGARTGPYNPYKYKQHLVPRNYPTNQQVVESAHRVTKGVRSPIRNMRHINPVRQSGPIPSYSGTYTMEDIKKIYDGTCLGFDYHYCQMDVDQIMRRVPGITRKEVQHIVNLGLTPYEQVDYAYLVYNLGLDVFYNTNQVYVARQVVTNSKGQKVEVMWNSMAFEDQSALCVGFAPILENIDYHWQIFLWADPPIKPTGDLDLGVPNSWFEYELQFSSQVVILTDQMNIPEDIRPFNTPRNPYARKQLWKSQQKLQEQIQMHDPKWVLPK